MSILSNFEMIKILNNLGINNVNIISKDNYNNNKGFYIVNMGDSNTQGTHWVSIIDNYYFDSFGLPPPKNITNYHNNIYYSNKQIQNKNDNNCGWYALMFIIYFNDKNINNLNYNDFIKQFNNFDNNKILINFFNKLL
jgi:hypothetical protein